MDQEGGVLMCPGGAVQDSALVTCNLHNRPSGDSDLKCCPNAHLTALPPGP